MRGVRGSPTQGVALVHQNTNVSGAGVRSIRGSWQLIGPGIRRRRQPVIATKNFVTQQHRHSKGKHAVLSLRSAISTSTKWSCSEKRERWQGLEWSREVGADDGCRGWAPIGKWRMRRRLFRGLWHIMSQNSKLSAGDWVGFGGRGAC